MLRKVSAALAKGMPEVNHPQDTGFAFVYQHVLVCFHLMTPSVLSVNKTPSRKKESNAKDKRERKNA